MSDSVKIEVSSTDAVLIFHDEGSDKFSICVSGRDLSNIEPLTNEFVAMAVAHHLNKSGVIDDIMEKFKAECVKNG